jgi:hypothetical protein
MRHEVEAVLADPAHPGLGFAIEGCLEVIVKPQALQWLRAIATDPRYKDRDRKYAIATGEKILANPFLAVAVNYGTFFGRLGKGRLVAPETITITNISSQEISLAVATAEELLTAKIIDDDPSNAEQSFPLIPEKLDPGVAALSGTLKLKPGEHLIVRDFPWWDHLEPYSMEPDYHYRVLIHARTPGLWEIPAKDGLGDFVAGPGGTIDSTKAWCLFSGH